MCLAGFMKPSGKFDIARLEYERALELNPNHSSARAQLMRLIERTRGRFLQ